MLISISTSLVPGARPLLLAVLLLGLTGCSGSRPAGELPPGPTGRDMLTDLRDMLKIYKDDRGKAATKLSDLETMEGNPVALAALTNKDLVVFFKAEILDTAEAGNVVLAYYKDVPTSGGLVLMQNGTIKEMTASEFASAPKVGK